MGGGGSRRADLDGAAQGPASLKLLPGWAAGLTRWILPDPSIGTGSRVAQAAQAVVVGVVGLGTQGLVSPRSNALGASFGVCSRSMLECQLASWACGRLVEGEGSVSSLRPQPESPTCRDMAPPSQTEFHVGSFLHCSRMGWDDGGKYIFFEEKKEAAGSRARGRVGRESRPSSRGTLRHGLHWRGKGSSSPRRGRCMSHRGASHWPCPAHGWAPAVPQCFRLAQGPCS